jgi:murein DD-endopeptidase MepM/ murein hydrolase activator NlpD
VPRIRHRRLGVVALPIALAAVLGSSFQGRPIEPIGEVKGVVAARAVTPSPSPARPAPDLRLTYERPVDRDGPRAGRDALAPRPAELTGYVWPLRRGRITLPFKAIPGGSRIKDGRLFHDGIDMATFCGDRVDAAHDGVVLAAGRRFDEFVGWIGDLAPYYRVLDKKKLWDDLPNVVVIDDGNGYRSVYAHFSEVTVKPGDVVRAGQRIGFEGATGHASGCHVHYGLFSPLETKTFGVRKDILHKLRVPKLEIARIDPLLILPGGAEALRTRQVPKPSKAPNVAEPAPKTPASRRGIDRINLGVAAYNVAR